MKKIGIKSEVVWHQLRGWKLTFGPQYQLRSLAQVDLNHYEDLLPRTAKFPFGRRTRIFEFDLCHYNIIGIPILEADSIYVISKWRIEDHLCDKERGGTVQQCQVKSFH